MGKAGPDAARFIVSTFPSVWSLELLLLLMRSDAEGLSRQDLVTTLRASNAIVVRSVEAFLVAGLVIEENDLVRYQPASADLAALVEETERLYRERPDAVRRLIAQGSAGGPAAFADAFKLRGE